MSKKNIASIMFIQKENIQKFPTLMKISINLMGTF